LYKAMNRKCFNARIAMHKRVLEKFYNSFIQLDPISSDRMKNWSEFRCSFSNDFLRNRIRKEKCTQTQQFGGCRVGLFNLLKGK